MMLPRRQHSVDEPADPLGPELILGIDLLRRRLRHPRQAAAAADQKMLTERDRAIEGGINRADEAQAEAQAVLEQYRAQLDDARHEAARMREEAQGAGRADHRRDARAGRGRGPPDHRGRAGPDRGRAAAGADLAARRGRHAGHRAGQPHRRRVAHRRGPAEPDGRPVPGRARGAGQPAEAAGGQRSNARRSRASYAELPRPAVGARTARRPATAERARRRAVRRRPAARLRARRCAARWPTRASPPAEKGAVAGRAAARQGPERDRGAGRRRPRRPTGRPRATWPTPSSSSPIEALMVLAADADDALDDLEDDLFRFGRVVSGAAGAAGRAGRSARPPTRKRELLGAPARRQGQRRCRSSLITQVLTHPRGRSPRRRSTLRRSIAARRAAAAHRGGPGRPPSCRPRQRQRLADGAPQAYGQGIHLNVVNDPAVVGGISVQIGDELIDGTAASRLAEVRRKLAG